MNLKYFILKSTNLTKTSPKHCQETKTLQNPPEPVGNTIKTQFSFTQVYEEKKKFSMILLVRWLRAIHAVLNKLVEVFLKKHK